MKRSNLSKIVGSSLLGLSLATLPVVLPASAQTDTTTSPSGTNNTTVDTTRNQGVDYTNRGDRDFDWGWLGLLGLAGLAGLARRKQEDNVRYRDPDEVSRPGARY